MKTHRYLQLADECRHFALILAGLGAGAALAALAVWTTQGAGLGLLACLSVAGVSLGGAVHERGEAARLARRADEEATFQQSER